MPRNRHHRPPISTRHAFALAFDLAVRRDVVHSIVVPLLLRAPWILAAAILWASPDQGDVPIQVGLLANAAVLGDFLTQITVSAMLRFRARSVFNTPSEVRPAPVMECYGLGLKRLPWLFLTEAVRNLLLVFATFFFILPAFFLGWRLSFATEAVVLHERDMASAFQRSSKLAEGRLERWFEMVLLSGILGMSAIVFGVAVCLGLGFRGLNATVGASQLAVAAILPIIQYAWTFFYLRLVEVDDQAPGIEVGPAYAHQQLHGPEPMPTVEPGAEAFPPMLTLVSALPVGEHAPAHSGGPEPTDVPPDGERPDTTERQET